MHWWVIRYQLNQLSCGEFTTVIVARAGSVPGCHAAASTPLNPSTHCATVRRSAPYHPRTAAVRWPGGHRCRTGGAQRTRRLQWGIHREGRLGGRQRMGGRQCRAVLDDSGDRRMGAQPGRLHGQRLYETLFSTPQVTERPHSEEAVVASPRSRATLSSCADECAPRRFPCKRCLPPQISASPWRPVPCCPCSPRTARPPSKFRPPTCSPPRCAPI